MIKYLPLADVFPPGGGGHVVTDPTGVIYMAIGLVVVIIAIIAFILINKNKFKKNSEEDK